MNKAPRTLIITIAALLICFMGTAPSAGNVYNEPAGGFSYEAPQGWTIVEFPGLKYKIAHGTAVDGFAPNINVVDEAFNGSVEEYVNTNLKQAEAVFVNFRKLDQRAFVTNSGVKGVKLATESTQQKFDLRQTFYFLKGKAGKMFTITCSTLAKDGNRYAGMFDASLKTFTVK